MLSASTGSWSGTVTSYAYQWLRCDSAGSNCAGVSGAAADMYALGAADVGSTMRVRVTAMNSFGSASATSEQTAVVVAAPPPPSPDSAPPPDFPASFFTGPLGAANILPGKTTGALLGTFGDGEWSQQQNQWISREAHIGRRFDFYALHYAAPNDGCDYGVNYAPYSAGREAWVMGRGAIPIISWTHGWTIASVNAGLADACLRAVARRAAAFGHRHLLRTYWEFNGTWMRWSGSGQPFIDAWRRTVRIFQEEGATNVGFVWSPDGGYRDRAFASYPGDAWVDWAGVSAYNMNKSGAWCSPYDSGPWCELGHGLTHDPVNAPTVYDVYSARKPFMVAETGSVEDPTTLGRKGQWMRNASDRIPANVRALAYFDVDLSATEGFNWRLDTSQSALDGFRTLALNPFFNTR